MRSHWLGDKALGAFIFIVVANVVLVLVLQNGRDVAKVNTSAADTVGTAAAVTIFDFIPGLVKGFTDQKKASENRAPKPQSKVKQP